MRLLGVLMLVLVVSPLRADGGAVRASQGIHGYRVTVFTDPTPVRVGLVDISVLIQDAQGRPLTDVPVDVRAWPVDAPHLVTGGPATTEAATNKLLRAIPLTLSEAGTWRFEVTADLPEGAAKVEVTLEVGQPPPSWLELAGWIVWPLVPVLVFVVREWRSRPSI